MVDPDPEMRARCRRELRRDRHEPATAGTLAATATALRRDLPELILLEWALPDGTALDLCALLAADAATRAIPFVFVSAQGDEAHRIRGFEIGA